MATVAQPTSPNEAFGPLLAGVRRLVRWYVWIEGLALVGIWIALAFWISLVLDWSFEPPPAARKVMLAVVAGILGWIIYRYILRRAFVPIADSATALVLERRFQDFHDSLLTSIELSSSSSRAADFNADMLAHTRRQAQRAADRVQPAEVFRWSPLAGKAIAAVVLLATVLAFGIFASEAFGIWYQRSLTFSDQLWPRNTKLIVDGFEDGIVKVGKGTDRLIVVRAESKWHEPNRVVPDRVQIRFATDDGATGREYMSREGDVSESHPFAEFKYSFKGILSPVRFDVIGGDDRVRDLRIEVVDNPVIERFVLSCEYPAYMNRTPREIPVTGSMALPQGARVKIKAHANKPLVEVAVQRVEGQANVPYPSPDIMGEDRRDFAVTVDALMDDHTFLFSLVDADGIRTKEPFRLTLTAQEDDPPQVAVRLRGIGAAITPNARLPVEGEITDTYGIARIWFEYALDQDSGKEQPFGLAADLAQRLKFGREGEEALDIQDQNLPVKHRLRVAVRAADACTLSEQPNVGSSEPYTLDIVTPDELRAILEARELTLRRRFESIIEEMTEMRDSLARIDFSAADAPKPAPADEAPGVKKKLPGAEPEDTLRPETPAPAQDAASEEKPLSQPALRQLRVQRGQQNSQKSGQETLGVAAAFDEIRDELINNRIETEELRLRLGEGIILPLRRIVEKRFTSLDKHLEELKKNVANAGRGSVALNAARKEADAILVEMDQILYKMLELEQFNELVEQLRKIIDLQTRINDETQIRRKEKAKSLLNEDP